MNTNLTAQELREKATACSRRVRESEERSDTDGFLSQWAGSLSAQMYTEQARIVENGGKSMFNGLYEGNRRVAAKAIEGRFGWCWMLRDEEEQKFGRKFVPMARSRESRIQKQLGLRECMEMAPAWAKIDGKGTGLSGTCWVSTYRTGCEWGTDAELVEE